MPSNDAGCRTGGSHQVAAQAQVPPTSCVPELSFRISGQPKPPHQRPEPITQVGPRRLN